MSLVEYYDPDGLFPVFTKQLHERLPLQNVQWTTSGGAVRTIERLDVSFKPLNRQVKAVEGHAENEGEAQDGGKDGRRHQLPGLQQTPLLKLYVLRCDDKEQYKSVKRDAIHAWLDQHAPGQDKTGKSSNRFGAHEASEWLVLHVVLPNTVAAAEPKLMRDSGIYGEGETSTEKPPSNSHWPAKKTRSILERLRTDFKPVSKSAVSHISQIRLRKDEIPLDVGPELPPPQSASHTETSADQEVAWTDFISKLKSLILAAFTYRVVQYEHDINERESQRTLPGWNFCTFFILKESLSRLFERVSLVEEALKGYRELSAELNILLQETLRDPTSAQAMVLAPHTKEFADLLHALLEPKRDLAHGVEKILQRPLDISRKEYRQAIAASTISAFEFQNYVHARILALILRIGKPGYQAADIIFGIDSVSKCDFKDLSSLKDVSQEGEKYTNLLGRLLRRDLAKCATNITDAADSAISAAIEMITSAWIFTAAEQLYKQTVSNLLNSVANSASAKTTSFPSLGAGVSTENTLLAGEDGVPRETTLNVVSNPKALRSQTALRSDELQKAAGSRAELCLMQIRALRKFLLWVSEQSSREDIPNKSQCSSKPSPDLVNGNHDTVMCAMANNIICKMPTLGITEAGVSASVLYNKIEDLSCQASELWRMSGKHRSLQLMRSQLVCLREQTSVHPHPNVADGTRRGHEVNDLAKPFLNSSTIISARFERWSRLDHEMSLRDAADPKLHDHADKYVETMLHLVAKDAERGWIDKSRTSNRTTSQLWLNEHQDVPNDLFSAALDHQEHLSQDMRLPLMPYFEIMIIDEVITLLEDRDGFNISMKIRPRSNTSISGAQVVLDLYGVDNMEGTDLCLTSDASVKLDTQGSTIQVMSKDVTFGYFQPASVAIRFGKIVFVHQALQKHEPTNPLVLPREKADQSTVIGRTRPILCFPRADALQADIYPAKSLKVKEKRCLEFSLNTGNNTVQHAHVVLRSGSAGLRLHTAKASSIGSKIDLGDVSVPGAFAINGLSSGQKVFISIPFDFEHDTKRLSVFVDVRYDTGRGSFRFMKSANFPCGMDIDVSVQDVFHFDWIQSMFLLSPTDTFPLRVSSISLRCYGGSDVEPSSTDHGGLLALSNCPATISYRLKPRENFEFDKQDSNPGLRLLVAYASSLQKMLNLVKSRLIEDLDGSAFKNFKLLLLPVFESSMHGLLTESVITDFEMTSEYKLPSFDLLHWDLALKAVPKADRAELKDWLQSWHESHNPIHQDDAAITLSLSEVEIDFEVPKLDFLCQASVELHENYELACVGSQRTVPTGQAIVCRVKIQCTNRWALSQDAEKVQLVTCHLIYDPTAWVVSGPTQCTFSSPQNGVEAFDLRLMPIKAGFCLLPTVEVVPFTSAPRLPSRSLATPSSQFFPPGSASLTPSATLTQPKGGSSDYFSLQPGPMSTTTTPNQSCETRCITAGSGVWVVKGTRKTGFDVSTVGGVESIGV